MKGFTDKNKHWHNLLNINYSNHGLLHHDNMSLEIVF